jgi:phospholipid/cholesterol/gamma-HCH transport system substrate-binding protein
MERSTLDLWVGLFVCAGIAALLVLAMKVGNMTSIGLGNQTYTLYANFDNIGGLKPRAPVKSAGVVVGRVTSIGCDNERFNARVELAIENSFKFPKDTTASILTSGLLGEQYIGLEAGGDPQNLASGESLKLTQSAVVLEKLISQFLYSKAAEGGDNNAKK